MNNGLKYTGTVTIKTLYKDKVLKERTYHNTGCSPLFEYIVACLSGNASKYSDGIPTYIRLWSLSDPSATPFAPNVEMEERTYNPVPWSDASASKTDEPVSASVSYTFLVSGANIDTTTNADVLAIYNIENQAAVSKPSAWIKLEEGEELHGSNNATGISYLIIWTMTISNQAQ